MTPLELVKEWVERFNNADAEGLAALYAPDALSFLKAQRLDVPVDYLG